MRYADGEYISDDNMILTGPWTGYPLYLKDMMQSFFLSEATCSLDDALRCLIKELNSVSGSDEASMISRVSWVDRFFRDCLIDFDCYGTLWRRHIAGVAELLDNANRLLEIVHDTYDADFRFYKDEFSNNDISALSQRMNSYLCVSAALREKDDQFLKRLNRSLQDTEMNALYLMHSPHAERIAVMEDTEEYGFYLPGQRYWSEPLYLVSLDMFCFNQRYSMAVVDSYRHYIHFLQETDCKSECVRGLLISDASRILDNLIGLATDEF